MSLIFKSVTLQSSAKQEETTEDERMTGNKETVLLILCVIQAACSRIGKLVFGRT